jgi:hypothetical protein
LAIASNLESIQKYFQQYSALWVIFLIFGLCQYTISALMVINDTHFTELELGFLFQESVRGSLLFDMSWNVFLFNGLITTISVLIILSSLIFRETCFIDENQDSPEV